MIKVLIVDDEVQIRTLLSRIIALEGYKVLQADSLKNAVKQIKNEQPDIVICDVCLPDGNGVNEIGNLKAILGQGEIIMLTAHGNIVDGVSAIKNGAYDYLTKGDDNNRIVPMLANAAKKIKLQKQVSKLEQIVNKEYSFESIIGNSRPLMFAVEMAKKVAQTDTAILLNGETGTGKEVFAKAIHRESKRNCADFIAINCGAISSEILESELFGHKAGAFTGANKDKKGLFEQAQGGTIFLDEVGEMSQTLQVKFLRVLETGEFIAVGDTKTKKVDVRIIAATNKNLKQTVEKGEFREDLFYRLSVFAIELPPLRERKEDVVIIAKSLIEAFACKMNKNIENVDPEFFQILQKYSWPGNIRELRNAIERSVILSSNGVIKVSDLPIDIQISHAVALDWTDLAVVEKKHICRMLQYTNGNKTEAAKLMKIGLTTLYRKIEEYKIIAP